MYAKLINNELKIAPKFIVTQFNIILNPREEDYLQEGYKPFLDMPKPLVETGKKIIRILTEEDNKITATYELADDNMTTDIQIEMPQVQNQEENN